MNTCKENWIFKNIYVHEFGSKYTKRKENIDKYNYLSAASIVFVDDMKAVILFVQEYNQC